MFTPEAIASYIDMILLTTINLLVSYLILKRFLFKPLIVALRKRRESVERLVKDTVDRHTQAGQRLEEAAAQVEDANRESAALLSEARSQAEVQRETILSEARRNADTLLAKADADIGRMRSTMLNDVRDEVADLSVTIASKVVGRALDERRQRELVDSLLDDELKKQQTQPADEADEHA